MNALSRTLTTLAAVVPALAALAGSATASADNSWQQETLPIAGASFTCGGTTLTAPDGTDGTITFDYHMTTAADGSVRDNGRGTPHHATPQDPNGDLYRLVGAFSFTDTYDPATGDVIAGTSSDQFTIVDAEGALFGRVGALMHLDRDGTLRFVQFGSCTDDNN